MPKLLYANKEPNELRAALGERIDEAMQEHGVSIKDLSRKLEITYEHARRLARGEAVPSRILLRNLAAFLKLPFDEVEKIATADRIRRKYGTVPMEITGHDPEMEGVERSWHKLTEEQKQAVTVMVQSLAKQNKVIK